MERERQRERERKREREGYPTPQTLLDFVVLAEGGGQASREFLPRRTKLSPCCLYSLLYQFDKGSAPWQLSRRRHARCHGGSRLCMGLSFFSSGGRRAGISNILYRKMFSSFITAVTVIQVFLEYVGAIARQK